MAPRVNSTWVVLAAILCLAAFLRFYGIDYGLPHQYLHDENVEVVRALRLGAGQYNWSFDRAQRGGFFYILFFECGVYFLGLLLAGKVQGAADFALRFARNPTPFFLMGRLTAALFGIATIGALYAFSRRFAGRTACLAACFFLAVSSLHVMESHAISLDVSLTLFSTLAFYFMTRITEEGSWRDYVLAGFCLTFASLHKIYMLLLIFPFLGAHFWRGLRSGGSGMTRRSLLDRKLLVTSLLCVLLYLVANPGIVVNVNELLDRIRVFYGAAAVPDKLAINYAGPSIPGYLFYVQSFFRTFGVGIAILGLLGMGGVMFSRDRRHWVFLGFFFLLFGLFASTRGMFSNRYLMPLHPLFALYAGLAFSAIARTLIRKSVFVGLAAVLLCLQPLSYDLAESNRYTKKDTRTLAEEWFETNVPQGSHVLIQGLRTFPNICSVPLKPSAESLEESISRYYKKGSGKGKLLTKFFKPSPRSRSYHLILTGEHLERRSFQDYLDQGIEYAVVCECEDDLYLSPDGRKRFPRIADIYLKLEDPNYASLLKRFERTTKRPGPEIRIYRVRKSEGKRER